MDKIYTGVGSRNTPTPIVTFMEAIGQDLASDGWTLRSGGAEGADKAFEKGWWNWRSSQDAAFCRALAELYIPWDGFNNHTASSHDGCNVLPNLYTRSDAEEIAARVHPAWDNCSPAVRCMHTRNVYQVLGASLDTPSDMLICWAKPQGRGVQGGTATSYAVAKMFKVRCLNLYFRHDLEALAALHGIEAPVSKLPTQPNRLFCG